MSRLPAKSGVPGHGTIEPRQGRMSKLRLAIWSSGHEQNEIARRLGVSRTLMSFWVNGLRGIDSKYIPTLQSLTGQTDLIGWVSEEHCLVSCSCIRCKPPWYVDRNTG